MDGKPRINGNIECVFSCIARTVYEVEEPRALYDDATVSDILSRGFLIQRPIVE